MPTSIPSWRWLPRHTPKGEVTVPLAGQTIWRRTALSTRAEATGATTREASRTTSALRKGSVRVMGFGQGSRGPGHRHHSFGGAKPGRARTPQKISGHQGRGAPV